MIYKIKLVYAISKHMHINSVQYPGLIEKVHIILNINSIKPHGSNLNLTFIF